MGRVALVLALVAAAAPLVAWIAVAVSAVVQYAGNVDDIVYAGVIGGLIVFLGVVAVVSPLALAAAVLGLVSLRRPGKAPGVAALVLGLLGSLGLLGLPFVLGEVVPGL